MLGALKFGKQAIFELEQRFSSKCVLDLKRRKTMEDEASFFHDHSTLDGRLSLFLHRLKWKYVIPPAVFLAAVALFAVLIATFNTELKVDPAAAGKKGVLQLAPGNSLLGADDPALDNVDDASDLEDSSTHEGWTVIKQPKPGFVEAEGCENGLYSFEGFEDVKVESAKSLRIRNLVIDAPALSRALEKWTSLESLVIENVWVNGNFSRVYLPALTKFIYHQFRNGLTDQYKQQETLKQTLFFDKSPNGTWDLNRDLLNLGVTVQVTVEGTKILDVEPETGEININTHECQQMLENFESGRLFNLSSLSLSWCSLGEPFLEKLQENSESLKYLLLNNAVPGSTADVARVTSSLRNLHELHIFQRFHCDWPGYEIYLNVSDLAPSLETLSVTNLDISYVSGVGAPSVKNISLDQYVGAEVAKNFDLIFPNVKTIALFNITQNRTYPLIERILTHLQPEQLIVTDLQRLGIKPGQKSKRSSNTPTTTDNAVIVEVERLLTQSGLPKKATSFLLELERSGNSSSYRAKELTSFQRNFYRFSRLAFKKIDTYTDYVIWDADPK